MNNIVLDFTGIRTLWDLHEYFKEVFHLPTYYGYNMDALWDCLHCSFEAPTTILLKDISKIPAEMENVVETMLELFYDLEKEDAEVSVVIADESEAPVDISDYMV